jgi:hypothetical protein
MTYSKCPGTDTKTCLAIGGVVTGAIPIIGLAFAGNSQRLLKRSGVILIVLTAIAAPIFLFGLYLAVYEWSTGDFSLPWGSIDRAYVLGIAVLLGALVYYFLFTTLRRLAAIDFGIEIDINLDDLRLNEKGFTRSHFHFCRILYPISDRDSKEKMVGYLLNLKLSLTGNEGEVIRRYRLDEPAFPHHSTADQSFTEAQFEAYRTLGEHVGDKLFLRAIVGDLADCRKVNVEEWFIAMGNSLLEPRPDLIREAPDSLQA